MDPNNPDDREENIIAGIAAINELDSQVFALENQAASVLNNFIPALQLLQPGQVPAAQDQNQNQNARIDQIMTEQQQQREMLVSITQALQQVVANTYVTEETQALLEEVDQSVSRVEGNTEAILDQTTPPGIIYKIFDFIKLMFALLIQVRDLINRFRPSRLPGSGPIMTILRLISLFIELSIFLTILKVFIELFGVDDGSVVLVNLAKVTANKIAGLYVTVFNLLKNLGSPVFQVLRAFGEGLLDNPQVREHYNFVLENLISYLTAFKDLVMDKTGLGAIIEFIQANNGILGAVGNAKDTLVNATTTAASAVKDAVSDAVSGAVGSIADASLGYLATGMGSIAGLLQRTYIAASTNERPAIGIVQYQLPGPVPLELSYVDYLPTNSTNISLPNFTIPELENMSSIIDINREALALALASEPLLPAVAMIDTDDIEVLEVGAMDFLNYDFEMVDLEYPQIERFDLSSFYEAYIEDEDEDENMSGGYKYISKSKSKSFKYSKLSKTSIPFKNFSINLIRDFMIAKFNTIKTNETLFKKINNNLQNLLAVNTLNLKLSMNIVFFCETSIKLYISDLILRGIKIEKEGKKGGKRKSKSRKHMKHKTHKCFRHKNKKVSKKRYKKRHSKRKYRK
jgi:hypothetical protein